MRFDLTRQSQPRGWVCLFASILLFPGAAFSQAFARVSEQYQSPYIGILLGLLFVSIGMMVYHWLRRRVAERRSHELEWLSDCLKQSEEALKESEERHRKLVESIPDIVYKIDADGLFRYLNDAIRRLGYVPDELLGKHFSAVLHPDDVEAVSRAAVVARLAGKTTGDKSAPGLFDERRSGARMTRNLEVRLMPKNSKDASFGSVCSYGEIISTGHYDYFTPQDKAFLGTVGIIRDITERKQTEENLKEALRELQATQLKTVQEERLHALGEMAYGIAHDVNNALSPILGFSELLLLRPQDLEDREKVTRYLKLINNAAEDAASVVGRLSQFYRRRHTSDVLQPVDLNDVVTQAVDFTRPRWKEQALSSGVHIHVETELGEIPRVGGDEADLRQVLTNLIFNAVEAMPKGGKITIRTSVESRVAGDEIVPSRVPLDTRHASHVTLSVDDTGAGMTEEVRRRCLEPFFTTRGQRGTGMGLPIIHGIVRRHDGELEIHSAPGEGTRIAIRLPVFRDPSRNGPSTPPPES